MESHDLSVSQYLEQLTGQIRSKHAKSLVEQEILAHIEEQADAYRQSGAGYEEAQKKAVKDMGDPVTVGIEMDRIHRPRSGWKFLLIIAGFSAMGLLVQYLCLYQFLGELKINQAVISISKQAIYTIGGLLLMVAIYYADYSAISKYGKQIGIFFLFLIVICSGPYPIPILNGSHAYIKSVLYLFVPIYGGILYRYRAYHGMGIVFGLLWLAAAFLVGVTQIGGGLGVTLDMVAVCYFMLLLAIGKGWFQVKKKVAAALMVGVPAAAGGIGIVCTAPYLMMRLSVMLHPELYAQTAGYQSVTAQALVKKLTWYGAKRNAEAGIASMPAGALADVRSDYIMLQIASVWGILAVCVLAGALLGFFGYLFYMIHRQKNQLGQVIGFGCIMVLAAETGQSLFNNFGFYTVSAGGLPFFSYGGYHTLTVYALFGVLLSIYRYQDLLLAQLPKPNKKGILARYKIKLERL